METGKAKYLVVISYDAFSEDNWEKASKLPNLSKLIKNGAYSTELKSVYPTLTYVVHTTMVTGVYPEKHGIYHNNPFQPFVREQEQSWFWFKKDVKVPAIYDVLHKYHMKSAGILWPVTGKASIHYNIPEIRAIKHENQALKILRNGSPLFSIRMEKKFGDLRKGIEQPYLDNFTTMCAADTIKRKKPNLLLVHLIDLDDAKHEYGTDSPEIEKVLIRMDKRLGDICKAVEEAGIKEDTVFLVVGDHGQINVRYKIKLNPLLKESGLIYEENGEMKWRAYIQNAGGAAYLHLKEKDSEAELLALNILKKAITDENYGIERLYTGKELAGFHVDPSVRYMLEAKAGYCFDDSLDGPVVTDLKEQGIKYATHGFSPDKPDYKCNLVIAGDCIKSEFQLGEVQMVDIAPTMAKILGIDFNNCDGRSLDEIF
ncbi:alkaline phosphatase family protein [Anaerocolumna sedimenticola]|uniref:Alkaline phosphatase family protein n=1 Tax=Anaerocolumna sedimenticola TaxID=2696063 RepID=A0A6P1TV17_9FIRM|nr:ectonucleotide pyrophosphatase/phosphodiesterase [Anaerocolumna sedimenticola]QHQ63328.1 alkaline phosphatase family protein [Anaerocolumna sedimenticola]